MIYRLAILAVLATFLALPSAAEARCRKAGPVARGAHAAKHVAANVAKGAAKVGKAVVQRVTHPFGGRLRRCK